MKKIHTYRRAIVSLVIVQYCLAIGYASDEAGCFYNGTQWHNGSLVPSLEPCLSCKCVDSHLRCSLRVCPEQPIPPPRGCVLVQKKLSCCPHVSCKKYHNANENENRRVVTYNSNWFNTDVDGLNGGDVVDERQKVISKNSLYRRIEDEEETNGNDQRCLVASTYYPEGEKLPNDSEHPCDICFCIRGERKCTPKKCAPYIGNCRPKILEGQCCPANYECDHSDDTPFGSSHKPRQFDLLSYFFSDETTSENDANTEPSDRQPYSATPSPVSSTSEKSFFDAIREGLNYIDSNDEHVEKILDAPAAGVNTTTITDRPLHRNNTELSFFDILLSGDDDDDDEVDNSEEPGEVHTEAFPNFSHLPNFRRPDDVATVYASDSTNDDLNHDRYVLLEEQSAHESTLPAVTPNSVTHFESPPTAKTSNYDRSATERIINEYITYTSVPNYNFETSTLSTNVKDFETSTMAETTTPQQVSITPPRHETINIFDEENSTAWSTGSPTRDDEAVSETTSTEMEGSTRLPTTTSYSRDDNNETSEMTTTEPSLVSTFFEEFSHLFGDKNLLIEKHAIKSRPEETSTPKTGIVNIEGPIQSSTQSPSTTKTTRRVYPTIITSSTYSRVTTPPLIVTITSPTTRTYSTSSTTATTTTPYTPPSKSPSTIQIHTSTTKSRATTTTSIPTTSSPSPTLSQSSNFTVTSPKVVQPTHSTGANEHPPTTSTPSQPSLIDSNPSILDSDLNYDYGDQPTLPPSLPNLKIIPFLPADAVRKDSVKVHSKLEYYSTSYPVLTDNYENPYLASDHLQNQNADFTAFEVDESEAKESFNHKNDNPDFNSYSVESTAYSNEAVFGLPNTNAKSPDYGQYPSITTEEPNGEQTIISKYPAYSKYNVDYDFLTFNSEKLTDNKKYASPGSYEVLDGHEYSVQSRNPSFDRFETDYPERKVYSKIEYKFSTSNPLYGYNDGNNKFSPPSKTEGGFLPKEPLDDGDQYYDKLQTTKYLPDITTESNANLTGQLIGITSEDPFKNVIRTEPPPNLLTLIEDKEKLFHTVPELSSIDRDYPSIHLSDIEKEIISITTDTNYNPSPEYALEPLSDEYSSGYFHNDTNYNTHNATVSGEKQTNSTTKYSTEVSVSSNFQPNPTLDPEPKDFLGSLLGYIFKDNKSNQQDSAPTESSLIQETPTIPPFKKISSTSLSLKDILHFTKPAESSSKVEIPQRKNNKIYEYPTTAEAFEETSTPKAENFNILRDVLLATLNTPSNIDQIAHRDNHPTIDVPKPIYSSHSIHQFLNPIFAGNSELKHVTSKYSPISSDIDLTIPKLNSQIDDNKDESINNVFGPDSYQVLNDYPSLSNSRPFVENPIDYDALKEHHSAEENSASGYTQPLNSFQNSMGILKLAGCNIYGRMYRVGRIITESSNPCLECKCTEVGVHCTTLSC